MFVHDFVSVERPAVEVVDDFTRRVEPALGSIVWTAWTAHREIWHHAGIELQELEPSWPLQVQLGVPRLRPDAVVIPLSWEAEDGLHCFPALEADLEIVAFGQTRTHLHLLGRYRLPDSLRPWSSEASRAHRAIVIALRRFLELLASHLQSLGPPAEPQLPPDGGTGAIGDPGGARAAGADLSPTAEE